MKSSRRLNRPRHKLFVRFILVLVIVIELVYLGLCRWGFFDVKDIDIDGVSGLEGAKLSEKINDEVKALRIMQVTPGAVQAILAKKAPDMKFVDVARIFPSKVTITVESRLNKYAVSAINGVYSIDSENYVTGLADPNSSVDVYYDSPLSKGSYLLDDALKAGLVYSGLDQDIYVEGGNIKITLKDGGTVLLPQDVDANKVDEVYTLLQKIIQKYTIEGRSIELVDLRFSKPVIKLN